MTIGRRSNTKGNQWAHITSFSMQTDAIDISTFGNAIRETVLDEPTMIEFTGRAPYTPEVVNAVMRWASGDGRLPVYSHEWMCLYCGTPQPLPRINCSQCGAPRSWFIG